ncbi:hypothetical protein PP182_12165 [Maribacter sp. PR1]|uniref:Uncharacterized protein n=1 Tax=Maribacter cobaltidurans TaxID=1178778 RepID=A0ABU7IWD4_9FLAO|nr:MULTISPECIES: hypothetical protein [Maribacter]MDC6389442.1 hypothetical protein [Maribacter sp. PR1]MEE1976831.1 hypothetical protein [Maribacter cobaltidurans]
MNTPKPQYLRWVGDSVHNDSLDAPGFNACNGEEQVLQYFNLGEGPVYVGEKSALVHRFTSDYRAPGGQPSKRYGPDSVFGQLQRQSWAF